MFALYAYLNSLNTENALKCCNPNESFICVYIRLFVCVCLMGSSCGPVHSAHPSPLSVSDVCNQRELTPPHPSLQTTTSPTLPFKPLPPLPFPSPTNTSNPCQTFPSPPTLTPSLCSLAPPNLDIMN